MDTKPETKENHLEVGSTTRKTQKLFKDTSLFAISNFASKILIFFFTPLYTRVLSTEEYGIADLIVSSVNFIYPLLTLSIAEGTLRFAMDKSKAHKQVLSTSLSFINVSVLLLMLGCLVVFLAVNEIFEWFSIFVVLYTLYNYHNCLSNYVKAIGKTKLFAVQGIIMTIMIIICNVVFLLVWKIGIYGYLFSMIAGYIIPIIIMFVGSRLRICELFRIDSTLLKEMLKYSIPMIPTLLAWAINSYIDRYIIIGFLGIAASGLYSVAHKIPSLLTTVLAIFTQAWQLSAIENHGDDEEEKFHSNVYHYYDYVCVMGCVLVIILAKPMASFLYSNDFFIAWQYVPLLTVSALFSSHAGFLAAAFRASKKTSGLFWSVIIGSSCNLIANLILVPIYGIMGAAIATVLSFVIMWAIRLYLIKKIINIKVRWGVTIPSYLILVLLLILVTADIPMAIIYGVACMIVIMVIHWKDNIAIMSLVKSLSVKYKTKRKDYKVRK